MRLGVSNGGCIPLLGESLIICGRHANFFLGCLRLIRLCGHIFFSVHSLNSTFVRCPFGFDECLNFSHLCPKTCMTDLEQASLSFPLHVVSISILFPLHILKTLVGARSDKSAHMNVTPK